MKKIVFNTFKYLLFFAIGVLIFWALYRELEWENLKAALRHLNYFLIFLSVTFSVLAHVSRAFRWNMLIRPMGYKPRTWNTFLSILVLYFVNLIVPRAGEVARCTVLSQTDRIPFAKLLGTVIVERVADFLMLILLSIIIFAMNFSVVVDFFNEQLDVQAKINALLHGKLLVMAVIFLLVLIVGSYFGLKRIKKTSFWGKIIHLKDQFVEGIKTIAHMKHKWLFILHTCTIFFLWLIMLYVVFLAFKPTSHLTLRDGMLVFLMGGLAMLAPVQGGIGPWHFMVYKSLEVFFHIAEDDGKIFAAVAHTSTNLIYLMIGGLALAYLIFKYGKNKIRLTQPTGQ
ncbi:MAG: flippase-like domain-containing protein [Bacteroidales bacterium]|nr:flippase-like domain-containing protein [Bacteroidales bacterium]